MTEPAPEGIETKDVHSQMMSDGDFETKNLPGGYLPAGVPNTDRTGTQKEQTGDANGATDGDGTAEGTEADSGTGAGKTGPASKTTAAKSTTTKSTTSKS